MYFIYLLLNLRHIYLLAQDAFNWTWAGYSCVASVVLFIVFFGIGPGGIPWMIVPELFAQDTRAAAVTICTITNWLSNFTVTFTFPLVQGPLGDYQFVPFTAALALCWLYIYFNLPETKGKSTKEITDFFKAKKDRGYSSMSMNGDQRANYRSIS